LSVESLFWDELHGEMLNLFRSAHHIHVDVQVLQVNVDTFLKLFFGIAGIVNAVDDLV
jgi:fumarate reductase subunit D